MRGETQNARHETRETTTATTHDARRGGARATMTPPVPPVCSAGNRFLNPTHSILYNIYDYIVIQGACLCIPVYLLQPIYGSKTMSVCKTRPRGKTNAVDALARRHTTTPRATPRARDVSVDILLRRRSMHLKAHLRRVARVSHDGGPRRVDARVRAHLLVVRRA